MSSVMAQFKRAVRAEARAEAKAEFLAEGRKEGRAEGTHQAQEGFVMRMLTAGELTLRKIAEYSGLTLAQVKAIQKSMA